MLHGEFRQGLEASGMSWNNMSTAEARVDGVGQSSATWLVHGLTIFKAALNGF